MGAEALTGAEALLKELEQKKANGLNTVEHEFQLKIKELTEQTDRKIAEMEEGAKKEAVSKSFEESSRILGSAKLEAKRKLFDATERMLNSNLQLFQQALRNYTEGEAYADSLVRIAKYAAKRLGKGMVISCRMKDRKILEGKGFKTSDDDLQCIGGIIAYDSTKNLSLDLRFEELLRIKEEQVRAEIMEMAH